MEQIKSEDRILEVLLKQFQITWTITELSKEIKLSRVGIWKILKKLEKEKLIILSSIGSGKTNAMSMRLNWENIILERKLCLILTEEAIKQQRWLSNFEELKAVAGFTILYGSILYSSKEAKDIDILEVVSDKGDFLKIERIIQKNQKTQIKKIHSESFTKKEFENEIKKPNKIFIDAIKKGVVLFGQEDFIKFVRGLQQ